VVVVGEDVVHFQAQRSGVDLRHLPEEREDVVLPVVLTGQRPQAGIAPVDLIGQSIQKGLKIPGSGRFVCPPQPAAGIRSESAARRTLALEESPPCTCWMTTRRPTTG
jgi:hypothetical protein